VKLNKDKFSKCELDFINRDFVVFNGKPIRDNIAAKNEISLIF